MSQITEFLNAVSDNSEAVLARFGSSEMLVKKFMIKFLSDGTFSELNNAVTAADIPRTEAAAHTLKGVSANLGFDKLSSCCKLMVDASRSDDPMTAFEYFTDVKTEYERIISLINTMLV